MPRRIRLSLLTVLLLLATGCTQNATNSAEEVALAAGRAVAAGDWEAYRRLAVNQIEIVQSALEVTGGPGRGLLDRTLRGQDEARLRQEFDSVVRSGRLRDVEGLAVATSVSSLGEARWDMQFVDKAGNPTGVCLRVVEWQGGYRVTHISLRG